MNQPLISVVIPTRNRPSLLPVAVRSALDCNGDSVEVIVVPNGGDESYKNALREFEADRRLLIKPILATNGNAARNHGLSVARGKYVRFLDDDDYLLPAALDQLQHMINCGGEICSARVRCVDQDGIDYGLASLPNMDDFACMASTVSGFTLPVGNIFLKSCLEGCEWDTSVKRAQDLAWMTTLSAKREWHWVHFDKPVGVWFQHRMHRVSSALAIKGREENLIKSILQLHSTLERESRLNNARALCIANTLWDHVNRGFPHRPAYWSQVAKQALSIHKDSRPSAQEFRSGPLTKINPIYGEWIIMPFRRTMIFIRDTKARLQKQEHLRRL